MDHQHKMNTRAQRAGLRRLSERANAFSERPLSSLIPPNPPSSSSSSSCPVSLVQHLKSCNIALSRGLSDAELERIEAQLGFNFPPDLRALLAHAVPIGPGFPDWRSASPNFLQRWMNLPAAQVAARAARTGLWLSRYWGPRSADPVTAQCTARYHLGFSPPMVPLFGLFFLPALPNRAGNPVFFVRNGDVVCLGAGLGEFMRKAFGSSPGCEDSAQDFQSLLDEQDHQEFPFGNHAEEEETECGDDQEEEQRRWSTSMMSRRSGLFVEERSRSLNRDCNFDMEQGWGRNLDALACCSDALMQLKQSRSRSRSLSSSSSMRNSFNLDSHCERSREGQKQEDSSSSSSSSAWTLMKTVLRNLRLAAAKRLNLDESACDSVPRPVRRIEFWSDVADKMIQLHLRSLRALEGVDQNEEQSRNPFWLSSCLSPAAPQQFHRRTTSSASLDSSPIFASVSEKISQISEISPNSAAEVPGRAQEHDIRSSAATPMSEPGCSSANPAAPISVSERLALPMSADSPLKPSTGSITARAEAVSTVAALAESGKWVSSFLDGVAARLRNAGWREDDISEMVEGASPKSVLHRYDSSEDDQQQEQQEPQQGKKKSNSSSSSHYLFLDSSLSSCLKKAGFSVEEVSALVLPGINQPAESIDGSTVR